MLHITNGSSVSLSDSGLGGDILFWVDTLYEGPVPAGLTHDELTRLRDTYFSGHLLAQRDAAIAASLASDEIALWFEHDLYDQLQLIQILDQLAARGPSGVSLIAIQDYLGHLTGEQLAALWPARRPVSVAALQLASAAWAAFRSPDPTAIERLLRSDCRELPFLAAALERYLEQFPWVDNGLNRTERQILSLIDAGHRTFPALFRADQQTEPWIFMGDTSYRYYLTGIMTCPHPLVEEIGGKYRVTQTGREVQSGRADHIRLNGINRWLGGVHLEGSEARWRWSEAKRRLIPH